MNKLDISSGQTSQQPPCSSYPETKTVVLNDTPTSYWQ